MLCSAPEKIPITFVIGPFPVRTLDNFGPIPLMSGCGVGHFGPNLVGCFARIIFQFYYTF